VAAGILWFSARSLAHATPTRRHSASRLLDQRPESHFIQAGARGKAGTAALMKSPSMGGQCRLFTERACHKVSDLSRLRALPESLNQSVWS
jgi:hypothetical protein